MLLTNLQNNFKHLEQEKIYCRCRLWLDKGFQLCKSWTFATQITSLWCKRCVLKLVYVTFTQQETKDWIEIFKYFKYNIKCRVPQGSVLSSLLFNINVNDLPGTINKLFQDITFGDDARTLVTTSKYDEIIWTSNFVLHHIPKWFQANQFVVNADKINTVQLTPNEVSYYTFNLLYADLVLP